MNCLLPLWRFVLADQWQKSGKSDGHNPCDNTVSKLNFVNICYCIVGNHRNYERQFSVCSSLHTSKRHGDADHFLQFLRRVFCQNLRANPCKNRTKSQIFGKA